MRALVNTMLQGEARARSFPAIFLLSLVMGGCLPQNERVLSHGLAFNIRSADVASATAEPLDLRGFHVNKDAPVFNAQLHIFLNDTAAERFRRFNEAHSEHTFELQINGKVLLPAIEAGGSGASGGREMAWFVSSMVEAKRFAASLNKK